MSIFDYITWFARLYPYSESSSVLFNFPGMNYSPLLVKISKMCNSHELVLSEEHILL
jgi:hypothetical protein